MSEQQSAPPAWVRQPDESSVAHAALLAYRDLGPARTFVAAARSLGKNERLLRRWAVRYRWRERVWAWEVAQSRQDEEVARRQRDGALQQLTEDASRLWRAAMAYLWTLIDRDANTGKPVFSSKLTPAVALKFGELALKVQTNLAGRPDAAESDQPADPFQLTSAELKELIGVARELAEGKELTDEDVHQE